MVLKYPESEEQIALFEWASYRAGAHPELHLMFHIPNGGKRNITEAARFKRMGVKAGVPDICLPVARCGYHGLYIELKAPGGKASEYQTMWINELTRQRFLARVCVGWKEAADLIEKYLGGKYV